MKLFPTKKKGKHIKTKGKSTENGQNKKGQRKIPLGVKITVGAVLGITALALGAMAYLKLAAAPPDVKQKPNQTPQITIENGDDPSVDPPGDLIIVNDDTRTGGKYTFLLMGMDDGNGNTDVIMLATLDTNDYTLDIVNIPRDTLVNVSWNVKKANTLFSVMKKNGTEEDEYSGVREAYSKLVGYEVDFFVVVDLKAFAELVDAVGGIQFNVPRNMVYDDPAQNLHINIQKGDQLLNGKNALGLVRWRKNNSGGGYAAGDIGRIELTQEFLMAAATQILANKSSINITSMANIFLKYVETDLKINHVVWLAQELFKLDAENINFHMMPGNTIDGFNGDSYVTIYVNEWLELINDRLSPFEEPITTEHVSILTRGAGGKLYVTNGVWQGKQSWGSSSGGGTTTTPKPSSTPAPTSTPAGGVTVTPTPDITAPNTTENPIETPNVSNAPIATPDPFPPENTPAPTPEVIIVPPPATPPDDVD